jgi:hypothetical protein
MVSCRCGMYVCMILFHNMVRRHYYPFLPNSPIALLLVYSLIRPKSQIPSIRHDSTLSIGNFMLMMKKPMNLEFEPVHPKNVLLASVVHGISCLCKFAPFWPKNSRKVQNGLDQK